MKTAVLVLFTGLLLQNVSGQTPPPNDDYTNRIQLVGTDITFSGTTAGATVEVSEWEPRAFWGYMPYPTTWWSWTPTNSGQVTIDLADYSDQRIRGPYAFIGVWVGIAEYAAEGFYLPDSPNNAQNDLYGRRLDSPGHPQFTFYAEAGTNYDIQVCTAPFGTFTFHLVQTNAPYILVPPRDRAVAAGDSTFFGVMPGGLGPFTYQWRFNGNDLAGETYSSLAVENVDTSMAGSYSVIVSNDFGSIESPPALLTVRTNFIAPELTAIAVNADSTISFALSGDSLTYYRIQSSSNLINWTDEQSFPIGQHYEGLTAVIFNKGPSTSFAVPFSDQRKFFRAVLYQPTFNATNSTFAASQLCINNLRRIRFAKEVWASYLIESEEFWSGQCPCYAPMTSELDLGKPFGAPHCDGDPNCFDDTYFTNYIEDSPQCDIDKEHHVLEEPADEY